MKLLDLQLVYFTTTIRASCTARYLPLVFVEQGITDSQLGILLSVAFITGSVAAPILSMCADWTQHRFRFGICSYTMTCLIMLLYSIPYYWLNITDINILFIYFITIMFLLSFFESVGSPILESLIMLRLSDKKQYYGRIRVSGSIAWGIMHIIIGILLDYVIELHWVIYLYSICGIPIAITFYNSFGTNKYKSIDSIPDNDTQNMLLHTFNQEKDDFNQDAQQYGSETDINNENTHINEPTYLQTILYIFRKPYTVGIFLVGFAFGGGWTVVQSLLFVYLIELSGGDEDGDGTTYLLLGLSVGVSVIAEIPFFYYSNWFVNKLGYRNMVLIGLIIYVFRLIAYTFLTSDTLWLLLLIELLQGFTFSLLHVALIAIPSIIFPNSMQVTGQGLMSTIRFGIGPVVFLVTGGFIMELYGGIWLYRSIAIFSAIVLVIFYFLSRNNDIITENKFNQRLKPNQPM
eukprot:383525_1